MTAFQEIMAEHRVVRKPALDRLGEGVDIVDPLADERALAEEVLVHVRDRPGVRIDTRLTRKQARIPRSVGTGQGNAHSRLQQAVPAPDDARRMVGRSIQRMRQGSDQLVGAVHGQLGVGVQRDHMLDARQHAEISDDLAEALDRIAGFVLAAQGAIEIRELSALALVAHPHAFARIPAPRPVEQEEDACSVAGGMLLVEGFDRGARVRDQCRIPGHVLGRGVGKVGDQCEIDVGLAIGDVAHLKAIGQSVDRVCAREHARHHHHGLMVGGDPRGEIQARQLSRSDEHPHRDIDHGDDRLRADDCREHAGDRGPHRTQAVFRDLPGDEFGDRERPQHDRTEVDRQGMTAHEPAQASSECRAGTNAPLQLGESFIHQIMTDVPFAHVSVVDDALVRQPDRQRGDLLLGSCAALGQALDDMPIMVARGEIHVAVDVGRIAAQGMVHNAVALDEFAPVGRGEESQASDGVADRDLVGRLALVFGLDQSFDRLAAFAQPLLDPVHHQGQRLMAPLDAPRKLSDEGWGQRIARLREVRQGDDQLCRLVLCEFEQSIRPRIGAIAFAPTGGDDRTDAPEILDQRESEHDGNRPQLSQLQRYSRLVGGDRSTQADDIDTAVDMDDQFIRQGVDAREPGQGPVRQLGQLPAVGAREMPAGEADLLFDEVKIVQEPFGRWSDASALRDGG